MSKQSRLLNRKLRALGRTLVLTEFLRRLAIAVAASILFLAALTTADGIWEFTLPTRKILFAAAASMSAYLFLNALLALITRRRDIEELALLTEQQHPEFDSRLISAVQLSKANAAGTEAIVTDTERIARRINFLKAVDPKPTARAALALLTIFAFATAGFFVFQKIAPTLIKRAFLADIPIPRDTQITSFTGDLKIGIGDQTVISATAAGVLPAEGTLLVKFESGRNLDYVLTRADHFYAVQIEDVPESFTYQIRINDARSEEYQVEAIARPEIESITASQLYPDYTGIAPTEHLPGDFYLFPGSQLNLQLTPSKPLTTATLRLIGLDEEIPFDITTNTATFEVPTEGLTGFSITLLDTDGMEAKEPAVYRAELLGDEPPTVRITHPLRSEELVTRTARSLIAFEATDRFGIANMMLNFQINETDPRSEELAIQKADTPPTSLKHQYDWDLKSIEPPLKKGDIITYWITAQDRQRVSPGIGESERRTLRIVSMAEKRQDLLRRASDYLGGVGITTEEQQRLNSALGELIKKSQ